MTTELPTFSKTNEVMRACPGVTRRVVVLCLALAAFFGYLIPIIDYKLFNTFLDGTHLPPGAIGVLLMLLFVVNPLLRLLKKQWRLTRNESPPEHLHESGYIRTRLSKSRLNRRLHQLPLEVWCTLFDLQGQVFKEHNRENAYTIDSMPFPVCDNIRIRRCRLLKGEEHRGYCASKRRFYFGLKIHLLITGKGEPVELLLTPASVSDVKAFRELPLDLPRGAKIYGDRAYNGYQEEDMLADAAGIILQSQRKSNSKRPLPPWIEALGRPIRQRVETTFSQLEALLPKHIHAVTPKCLVLKILCFLIALSFEALK